MADENIGGGPIPDGWELRTDSNQKLSYYCPGTAQHFFTYEDLMRYVKYAQEVKLSIYAPDFKGNKHRGKPLRRRRRTNSELLNSRSLPVNQGMETSEPAAGIETVETTDTKTIEDGQEPRAEPVKTTDAGKANEAGQDVYALGGCYKE